MAEPMIIKIYYGPYQANGLTKHRFQKIRGLVKYLTERGFEIEMIPIDIINRMTIEIYNRTVFQCDIRNLMFNMEYDSDVVCQRAIQVVEEVAVRMSDESNIPKYMHLEGGRRAMQTKISETRQIFTSDIDLIFEVKTDVVLAGKDEK